MRHAQVRGRYRTAALGEQPPGAARHSFFGGLFARPYPQNLCRCDVSPLLWDKGSGLCGST